MKTVEERITQLEAKVVDLETAISGLVQMLAPLPYSLEDQHRLKLAARAKAKGE